MLPLDIAAIGADAYTGNLHKWVCAPKGSGFLWVAPEHRDAIHPTTISHFLDEGFTAEFDWQGTRDLSPWLAIGDALELWSALGWERLRGHNAHLRRFAARTLAERWGETPLAVECESLADQRWCSMATVPIPQRVAAAFPSPETLQAHLYERHAIEVPVIEWETRWFVRVSCQLYNRPEQYERLAESIVRLESA
jgi:isopenicillin-N epimerase